MKCLQLSAGLIVFATVFNVFMIFYAFQRNEPHNDESFIASSHVHKLQEIEENHRSLQQEHVDMIKTHNRLQERSLEMEGEHLTQLKEIHSAHAELLEEYKKLSAITKKKTEKLSDKTKKKDCPECDCSENEEHVFDAWAGTEYLFGFKTSVGIDAEPTDAAKKLKRKTLNVDRKDGSTFSYLEFYKEYVKKELPVVITNYFHRMCPTNWTLDIIANHCAGKKAQLKKYNPKATKWGNLVSADKVYVDEFVKKVADGTSKNEYLFDFSLHHECPTILSDFSVPKYFAPDYLQRVPSNNFDDTVYNYKNTWPSLFVGTGDTRSGLHVDAIQSHFWMGQIQGRKRWAIVPRNYVPLLYPDPTSRTFLIGSLFDIDLQTYPLVSKAAIYETTLEPGDLLYVPGGAAHEVMNLDTIIAISMNYVDEYNVERASDEMSGQHPEAASFLISENNVRAVPSNQQDLPWKIYKSWPRPWETYDLK